MIETENQKLFFKNKSQHRKACKNAQRALFLGKHVKNSMSS